jgi:hypothetical protein
VVLAVVVAHQAVIPAVREVVVPAALVSQLLLNPEALVEVLLITVAVVLLVRVAVLLPGVLALVMALVVVAVKAVNVAGVVQVVAVLVVLAALALLEPLLFNTHPHTPLQHLQQEAQLFQMMAPTKHIHGEALGLLHGKPIRDKNINL